MNAKGSCTSHKRYVVVDFEFTPVPKGLDEADLRYEIIEIGAVKLDGQGRVLETFDSCVRPQYAQDVSYRVKSLTGIRTYDVRKSAYFEEVFERFVSWVGDEEICMVAWSDCDELQVRSECAAKNVHYPAQLDTWLDFQQVYPSLLGVAKSKPMSLKDAVCWSGISFCQDKAHRALYDAQVTAEMMKLYLTDGVKHQRELLEQKISNPRDRKPASVNLGSTCNALGELLQQMMHESGRGGAFQAAGV